MKKIKRCLLITVIASTALLNATGQTSFKTNITEAASALTNFPELIMTKIPGAPKLTAPVLITGTERPILSQGHGLAAPAFYDMDGDGLKDLLIGEFGTGVENGRYIGNFVRVYKNVGTDTKPEFTGRFDYARPPYEIQSNGTPYSVDQFCCIGFTPQFVDLNDDKNPDMITGTYHGEVIWFEKTDSGFKAGEKLDQFGDPRSKDRLKKWHQFYWLYSAASFGDFTGDGKLDLIVGGRALRISRNIGTASEPKFDEKQLLLDIEGKPLKVYTYTQEDLKFYEERKFLGYEPPPSGDDDLSPYVVDWDNDGILDIFATNSYSHKGLATVTFFKGIKVKNDIRFKPGVALFTAKNEGKAFPGSGPRVFVTDWNNDGVKDLIIGASIATIQGEVNNRFIWTWEKEISLLSAGKDPSNLTDLDAETLKRYKQTTKVPEGLTIDEFMKIRHQGRIYVMLGEK